ncbi:putative efflux system component YhbJ [Candidatus Desulfosporosinus infrequens]|uniref:Putative efflux system component YhbJ n=1 Tax=Candidatus Desulfosporosinus infrequens TaxID=2043169 RepID=A0A2U3KC48_9FIRM|nr:putative efflux system component YhbJ [Candidatus Desulfosporosinus infrequens]
MAEADSKKKKLPRALIGGIVALLIAVGAGYYLYMMRYVSTDDAQISVAEGNSVPITVAFPGRLSTWKVNLNDDVNQGEVIGTESNQSVLSANPLLLPMVTADQLLAGRLIEMENIRSPISGKVLQTNAAAGQGVQPGQVLAVIANANQLQVTANIQETDISKIRVGQIVDLDLDGLPGQQLHGLVSRIDDVTESVFSIVPNVTAASGSYTNVEQRVPVIIQITDKNLAKKTLVPGMSAHVQIHVQ